MEARDTLIKNDYNDDEWNAFERQLEDRDLADLAAVADYLSLDPAETWEEYRDMFAGETWSTFIKAYEARTHYTYSMTL